MRDAPFLQLAQDQLRICGIIFEEQNAQFVFHLAEDSNAQVGAQLREVRHNACGEVPSKESVKAHWLSELSGSVSWNRVEPSELVENVKREPAPLAPPQVEQLE